MGNLHQWLQIMQICDSFFPVGAFSYSEGLESAVSDDLVTDGASLQKWLSSWCEHSFRSFEGLGLIYQMQAWHDENWDQLCHMDQEITALQPSSFTRSSSRTLGKRLLRTCLPMYPDQGLELLSEKIENNSLPGNAITMYAAVFGVIELDEEQALLSYAYMRLASMISSALRLISIGQQEGQGILNQQLRVVPDLVETIIQSKGTPLMSFNPLLDVCQMKHRFLYSRLFRS